MRHLVSMLLVLLVCGSAPALAIVPATDSTLVVMNLAAHPDDEDGRTLAYYRWAEDARAYSVIYTRGEGGQNEIGPELYEDLGAIRTAETERAARMLGTQVYFLNFEDFGFSKSAEETFDRWGGRDAVTARITYLIRKLKPDVLFTNHDTLTVGPGRQHGHHQAVGISAYDAFALAADPTYHPEQLVEEGVDLWQPKRLFLRHWNEPDGGADVSVPVGEEYADDKSYADMASDALREHASQGMAMFAGRFSTPATYFSLLRKHDDAPLDPHDLAANLTPPGNRPPSLRYLIDSKRIESLSPEAISVSDSVAIPGSKLRLTLKPDLLPALPVRIRFSGAVDTTLLITKDTPPASTIRIRPDAVPTYPRARFQYERFVSSPPVAYEVVSLPTGERTHAGYLALDVVPAVLLETPVQVVRARAGSVEVPIELSVWDSALESLEVRGAIVQVADEDVLGEHYESYRVNDRVIVLDTLSISLDGMANESDYSVILTAVSDDPRHLVNHSLHARSFDVKVPPSLRVGVVESYDDALSDALEELGVEHVLLDSIALAEGDLESLHTILVDIRAFLVRPDLQAHNERLLEWVEDGGHLVVNYHKTFEWDGDEYAPYPLQLSRARVTREDAPIRLLQPEHVLFHQPNEIVPTDWDGWVQERGLYFPTDYDSRYLELFGLSDPGEPELRGSTLLAEYGSGTYLYTALVWYRQLKEFHPGAYRMFANMISLPITEGRAQDELSSKNANISR